MLVGGRDRLHQGQGEVVALQDAADVERVDLPIQRIALPDMLAGQRLHRLGRPPQGGTSTCHLRGNRDAQVLQGTVPCIVGVEQEILRCRACQRGPQVGQGALLVVRQASHHGCTGEHHRIVTPPR